MKCLLTGNYEIVITINSCNESDVCIKPDFAIISSFFKRKGVYLGVLPQDSFAIRQ